MKMIKDDIARHLTDAGLSVHTIAARQKVSPRYVQRLFDGQRLDLYRVCDGRRLERAHRLLGDPRFCDRTLTAIAFAAGFNDLSHFQRRFRRRYGTPPSDLQSGYANKLPRELTVLQVRFGSEAGITLMSRCRIDAKLRRPRARGDLRSCN